MHRINFDQYTFAIKTLSGKCIVDLYHEKYNGRWRCTHISSYFVANNANFVNGLLLDTIAINELRIYPNNFDKILVYLNDIEPFDHCTVMLTFNRIERVKWRIIITTTSSTKNIYNMSFTIYDGKAVKSSDKRVSDLRVKKISLNAVVFSIAETRHVVLSLSHLNTISYQNGHHFYIFYVIEQL